MPRMLELIRASALSSHQMMSASRGALHLAPVETLQILVYIADHNKIYGEQARLTLAAWDDMTAKAVAAEPDTPKEILEYWLQPKNIRPSLFPILIENPTVLVTTLAQLATALKGELLDVMIASPRVRASQQLLQELSGNHFLSGAQSARAQALLAGKPESDEMHQEPPVASGPETPPQAVPDPPAPQPVAAHDDTPADPESQVAVVAFFEEH